MREHVSWPQFFVTKSEHNCIFFAVIQQHTLHCRAFAYETVPSRKREQFSPGFRESGRYCSGFFVVRAVETA